MGRKPRIVLDGSYYHVVQRGNDRRKIFLESHDYDYFYSLLRKYLKRYHSFLYHYCLMSNHFHMLMKVTKAEDMSKLMQGVDLSYTLYYKRKYEFIGSLWQGRDKSIVIERDDYLMDCGRYIERNPVRAGIVTDPTNYEFSSSKFYFSGKESSIITEDILYESLGRDKHERQTRYRDYVLEERAYDKILDRYFKL